MTHFVYLGKTRSPIVSFVVLEWCRGFSLCAMGVYGKGFFAANENGAVRPEAAVEPEVAIMSIGYGNERDVIAHRG
jgi:hypothetical protein